MPIMLTANGCDRVEASYRPAPGAGRWGATREDCGDGRSDVRVGSEGTSPTPQGQSARRLQAQRGAPDHRGVRPHLGVRPRAAHAHPGQGQDPHPDLQLLVREVGAHHPQPHRRSQSRSPVVSRHRLVLPRARRANGPRAEHRTTGDRGDRARVPVRLGLEGIPEEGDGVRYPAAGRPHRVGAAPRSDIHALHQGASGSRREHLVRAGGGVDRRRSGGPGARHQPGPLPLRGRARPGAGHHHRRHQVRIRDPGQRRSGRRRLGRWRADPHRRDAHAGLLPLLAGRDLRAGPGAGELRQAVRARLPGSHHVEQGAAGPRATRPRSSRRPGRNTGRPSGG